MARMRYGPAAAILIVAIPVLSIARWDYVPLDELVQASDLIVIGTLSNNGEHTDQGIDYGQGIITVEHAIWGNVHPGDSLILRWENQHNIVCPRVEHRYHANRPGIWLLTTTDGVEVQANYPGRFLEISEKEKVERLLSRKKICLRTDSYLVSPDGPATVSVVFRNPSQHSMQFPGMEYSNGRLYVEDGVEISIQEGLGRDEKRITPSQDRLVSMKGVRLITVPPGDEYRFQINLRSLIDLQAGRPYRIQVKIPGHNPTNASLILCRKP